MKQQASPSLKCGRRTFLKSLLQEAAVVRDAFKGKPSYRVADLQALPDEELAQIRPAINPACEITVDEGMVCARFKQTDQVHRLFPTEHQNLTVFNMFNGRNTLEAISLRVAQDPTWDQAAAFAHTKALFISLATRLVCIPENSRDL